MSRGRGRSRHLIKAAVLVCELLRWVIGSGIPSLVGVTLYVTGGARAINQVLDSGPVTTTARPR